MFHLKSGVHFERLPNGNVRLVVYRTVFNGEPLWRDPQSGNPAGIQAVNGRREAVIDIEAAPNEWASVVATVCAKGETAETYASALALHEQSK